MIKLTDIVKEIKVATSNPIIKPFKQNEQWFYFRDGKDGDDYHNFYYGGYYYGANDKFYTSYHNTPEGEEEKNKAIEYLERHNIPFSYREDSNEVLFAGDYVDFTGFTKSKNP